MNYNVRIKTGTFYLSSDQEKEGWERNEFFINGKNYIRFHKPITVEGNISYVGFKEDKFKGEVLSISVNNNGDTYYLDIPVWSASKTVETLDEYFKSFVESLTELKNGQYVKMFVNSKFKDKNDRLYRNIVILDENNKLIKGTFGMKDTPSWDKKETTSITGIKKTEWDASKQNEFYLEKAVESVKQFSGEDIKDDNVNTTTTFEEYDDDDLPF